MLVLMVGVGGHLVCEMKMTSFGRMRLSQNEGTGSHQVCVLSPRLFPLHTNECMSENTPVSLLKYANHRYPLDKG